jgi:hypothetical protein
MAEQIKCPICGEMNDANLELCTNCRSPLKPKSNIQSGQVPTKKNTAELEHVLPQWLRDARDAARSNEPQDSPSFLSQQDKPKSSGSTPDLLAGLESQAEDNDDEEVPDWLASITGASPKAKPAKNEPVTDVRWVEMGGKEDFAQSEQSSEENEGDVPPWLAGLQSNQPPEKDELSDWLRETDEAPNPFSVQANMPSTESNYETSEPILFSPQQDDTPDWLKQMSADAEETKIEAQLPKDAPELSIDTPDWLSSLGSTEEQTPSVESNLFAETSSSESEAEFIPPMDMPDWLKNPSEPEVEKPIDDTTTPLWLRKPKLENEAPEMPAWLSSEETIHLSEPKAEETPLQDDVLGELPDWLKASAPQSSIFDEPEKAEAKSEIEPASDSGDWFKSLQSTDTPIAQDPLISEVEEKDDPFGSMPSFTPDAETSENMEGLFTDMPDWLSEETPASSSTPTPTTQEDVLPSGSLPSWVEAMRPSDSSLGQSSSLASDQTLESRGALAGLQGVLPAMAGFAPTSKPKAYSLKLNASDEQQRHAAILEEILAAETAPVPLESFSTLRTSRSLRWTLSILMLAVVISTTFLKTQIFSLPRGVPSEVNAAIQIAQSLPENAPVLVAFDYEASRAGEMEAAAAPLFDQLLLLKHPRLTLIATNETGSTLAERFVTGPLAVHNYQSGVTYSNLGYLPGGQLGIRAFAQNPGVTTPFDTSLQLAWTSPPLQGVAALNQFTAMILITDNADAARVWVEQTESLRSDIPFIVISSSQAAPMIQPYYDSGQVNGIVPGLYGGAIFEQYNAGRPGTARSYWDAYSIGMLIAMSLVLGGGLWNLFVGLRERAALREEN